MRCNRARRKVRILPCVPWKVTSVAFPDPLYSTPLYHPAPKAAVERGPEIGPAALEGSLEAPDVGPADVMVPKKEVTSALRRGRNFRRFSQRSHHAYVLLALLLVPRTLCPAHSPTVFAAKVAISDVSAVARYRSWGEDERQDPKLDGRG